ncbi:MAG: hypothetical protein R3252_11530, partial [Robiginitalea sp.]|nr:hypothetical protein [Robiginitalea sp.]
MQGYFRFILTFTLMGGSYFPAKRVLRFSIILGVFMFAFPLFGQDQVEKQGSDPLQDKPIVDSTLVNSIIAQADSLRGVQADSAVLMYRRAIQLADEIDFE